MGEQKFRSGDSAIPRGGRRGLTGNPAVALAHELRLGRCRRLERVAPADGSVRPDQNYRKQQATEDDHRRDRIKAMNAKAEHGGGSPRPSVNRVPLDSGLGVAYYTCVYRTGLRADVRGCSPRGRYFQAPVERPRRPGIPRPSLQRAHCRGCRPREDQAFRRKEIPGVVTGAQNLSAADLAHVERILFRRFEPWLVADANFDA